MNRIILIGNGFDLAHGLETSYKHFIDDYWNRKADQCRQLGYSDNDEDVEFISNNRGGIGSYHDSPKISECKDLSSFEAYLKQKGINIVFKNRFLGVISKECGFKNWVDIEKEYYSKLKEFIHYTPESDDSTDYSNPYVDIDDLNRDFEKIKNSMIQYLKSITILSSVLKEEIKERIISDFRYRDFSQFYRRKFSEQYRGENTDTFLNNLENNSLINYFKNNHKKPTINNIEELLNNIIEAPNYFPDFRVENILLLNFNYTSTISKYKRSLKDDCNFLNNYKIDQIDIHGNLYAAYNPIIFGFGDEIDVDYSKIENLDDNRYLENIKSTKYHETDNYKKLLEYIDSDYFQIFIFGHSCGLSDRTLLSTLFNHDNCISIKPFYHKINDDYDNYSDLARNISRHFKNKAHLRDKVVNKTYCEPLTGSK